MMGEETKTKSFKDVGVCNELVEACNALGWLNPFAIQIEAIPHALQGRDIIGLASTGSGKTGAFAIPIIQALLAQKQNQKLRPLFACVLSPTRELAIQISHLFEALGSAVNLRCSVLVGGVKEMPQINSLGKRPDIIVATPGRLQWHLENTKGFSLQTVKYLVLDEADKLLNQDFEKSIDKILTYLPRDRRTYLFSATMTGKVKKLNRTCLKNPVKIETSTKYSTVDTVKDQFCLVPAIYKDCYLYYILTQMSGCKTMIFTRTCEASKFLAFLLQELRFNAIAISGQMSQDKRFEALDKFKAGVRNVLVCTDVMSRGLDIPCDLVINYNVPENPKDYIHRVGRTARAGRSGMAIALCNQYDAGFIKQIERLLGRKIPVFPCDEKDVLKLQEKVSDATRMAQMKVWNSMDCKKRRNEENYDNEDEVQNYMQKGNVTKKSKRR